MDTRDLYQQSNSVFNKIQAAKYFLSTTIDEKKSTEKPCSKVAQNCLKQLNKFDPIISNKKYPFSPTPVVITKENIRVLKEIAKLRHSCKLVSQDESFDPLTRNQFSVLSKELKEFQSELEVKLSESIDKRLEQTSGTLNAVSIFSSNIYDSIEKLKEDVASKPTYQFGMPLRTPKQLNELKRDIENTRMLQLHKIELPGGRKDANYIDRSIMVTVYLKQILGWKYNLEMQKQNIGSKLVNTEYRDERKQTLKAIFDTYCLVDSYFEFLSKNVDLNKDNYNRESKSLLHELRNIFTHHFSIDEKKIVQEDMNTLFKELMRFDRHFRVK